MTQDINTTINAELKKAFDPSVLQELPKGGRKLTYVPGAEVIARLNSALGTENWSITEADAWREPTDLDWIIAKVTLTATISGVTTTKIQYGGQGINYKRDSKEPTDLGNDFKGAVTDAFKKAATQLGVGLDIARKEDALIHEAKEETAKEISAARAALPKADEDLKKEIADAISELDTDNKKELRAFFVNRRLPALTSDDLTIEDAEAVKAKIVELST